MAREDAFNGAKSACAMLGGFLKDVEQEIGMEKALLLYGRQGEPLGSMLAGITKQQLGDKEFDFKTFAAVLSGAYQMFGLTYEIEENATSTKVRVFQCPIYEGFKEAGLDHQTTEALCNRMAAVEYAELKKVIPQLCGSLKFRSAPDQPCVEEFVLEK